MTDPATTGTPSGLAVFPRLNFSAAILSTRLAVQSNGATYDIDFELPVGAVAAIASMPESLTLLWEGAGSQEGPIIIGVGAKLQSSTLKPDADGSIRHKTKYRLSQHEIATGIGIIAAAIANDMTEGRLHIQSDQATFDLTARA